MERIDFDRFKQAQPSPEKRGEATPDQEVFAEALDQVVSLVQPGQTVHWYSKGDWSMWQLLEAVLNKLAYQEKACLADVHIASYAFSEQSARQIARMIDSRKIARLYCLLDNRTDTRSAGSLQLLKGISTELAMDAVHAKITLIRSARGIVTITGSANYTENVRLEAGTISCNQSPYSFYKAEIDKNLYGTHT